MSRRRRPRRAHYGVALATILLAALFIGGLQWFIELIPRAVADPDSATDAIVVLTGGSRRVESGLELLAAGKAQQLFVSGVHPGVELGELLRAAGQTPERVACCIALGHDAESTLGNARETASFMRAHDLHSLRLVTASYHMPRSLLEFTRAMPGITIVPNPVFPEIVRGERWWTSPASVALVAGEYVKYLVALARPYVPGTP